MASFIPFISLSFLSNFPLFITPSLAFRFTFPFSHSRVFPWTTAPRSLFDALTDLFMDASRVHNLTGVSLVRVAEMACDVATTFVVRFVSLRYNQYLYRRHSYTTLDPCLLIPA